MYTDRKKQHIGSILLILLIIGILLYAAVFSRDEEKMREEVIESMRESILRQALQCYTVEGVYPPDLEYLEDHYGLLVNRKDYVVSYEVFADNLPPEVRVVYRGTGQ